MLEKMRDRIDRIMLRLRHRERMQRRLGLPVLPDREGDAEAIGKATTARYARFTA